MGSLKRFCGINRKLLKNTLVFAVIALLILMSLPGTQSVVSSSKIKDWNYHELEKIDKTKNEFSFVVFGDNRNSTKTFDQLIKQVNNDEALFALSLGDVVHEGTKEEFGRFLDQIQVLNKPLLTTIGNHETRKGGRANYYRLFGRFYYSFAVDNSYFIVLDDANGRNLDPWQMEWLKNELDKSQAYAYRFVFMHVPLFDPRKGECKRGHSLRDLAYVDKMKQLFDDNQVTTVFAAHMHGYYRGTWEKIPYIITGGAGSRLAGNDRRHHFYHYIKISVSNDGVEYEVIKVKTSDFELMSERINKAWMHIHRLLTAHFNDSAIPLGLTCLAFLYYINANRSFEGDA